LLTAKYEYPRLLIVVSLERSDMFRVTTVLALNFNAKIPPHDDPVDDDFEE
jgi:hypothetical protein